MNAPLPDPKSAHVPPCAGRPGGASLHDRDGPLVKKEIRDWRLEIDYSSDVVRISKLNALIFIFSLSGNNWEEPVPIDVRRRGRWSVGQFRCACPAPVNPHLYSSCGHTWGMPANRGLQTNPVPFQKDLRRIPQINLVLVNLIRLRPERRTASLCDTAPAQPVVKRWAKPSGCKSNSSAVKSVSSCLLRSEQFQPHSD